MAKKTSCFPSSAPCLLTQIGSKREKIGYSSVQGAAKPFVVYGLCHYYLNNDVGLHYMLFLDNYWPLLKIVFLIYSTDINLVYLKCIFPLQTMLFHKSDCIPSSAPCLLTQIGSKREKIGYSSVQGAAKPFMVYVIII